jgi:hypothetical protein
MLLTRHCKQLRCWSQVVAGTPAVCAATRAGDVVNTVMMRVSSSSDGDAAAPAAAAYLRRPPACWKRPIQRVVHVHQPIGRRHDEPVHR